MQVPKKIPTIFGLILLFFIVGSIIFITEINLRTPSDAAGSSKPQQTKITNVGDHTFTISWITESPTTGTALISTPGSSNRIYYDERDSGGKLGHYISHLVTIRDAKPSTLYSIKILSNGRQYLQGNKPHEIKTPSVLPSNTNGLEPSYGTILTSQGVVAEDALVYLTLEGGQELSTLTKSTGLWLIPLNQVRTADLSSFLPTLERMDEKIFILHESGEITATTDSLNDSPVPEMTIGQTYDFRRQNAKTTTNTTLALRTTPTVPAPTSKQLPVEGASVLGTSKGPFRVTLISPAQNATFTTSLPLFSGSGVPDTFIGLAIGITKPISGSAKVKSDGTWNFTPSKSLAPGKQSVTITSKDSTGKTVAITHGFEIFKSGTQVLGDATPSGTLTLTPTPTKISTATETPTPTDDLTLSGEEIPTSGSSLPTILLIVIGLGLLLSGTVAIRL